MLCGSDAEGIAWLAQMPGSYTPVGYGPAQAGPPMQMPPPMAYAKGAPFMQAQQQRLEVTVPVPEARVSNGLPTCVHVMVQSGCHSTGLQRMRRLWLDSQPARRALWKGCGGAFLGSQHAIPHCGCFEEPCLGVTQVGAIIGKGGEVISQLKSVIGVKIRISDRDDFVPGTRNRKVTISGAAEAVQIAQVQLYSASFCFLLRL